MALLITKDVSILGEMTINEIYTRLNIRYDYKGNYISVETKNYVSKNSYLEEGNMQNFGIEINGIPGIQNFTYENDGDILLAAHNKLKDYLTTDIMKEVITYDPSTGDPSIGYEVSVPKFCEESDISIVDIS